MARSRSYRKTKYVLGINRGAVTALGLCVMLFAVVIVYSLFKIQILHHDELSRSALEQYYSKNVELPRRGNIYDRNGQVLATTEYTYTVGMTPKHVYALYNSKLSQKEIAGNIARILEIPQEKIEELLEQKDATYIELVKAVPQDRIENLNRYLDKEHIGGIKLDKVPRRVYNNGYLASQVIGFAKAENGVLQGRLGLEYSLNDVLTGRSGYTYGAYDNLGFSGALPFTEDNEQQSRNGYNVYTTHDSTIQKYLQDALEEAVITYAPKKYGMGIVMDINNGSILGMASYPYFKSSDPEAEPKGYNLKRKWDVSNEKVFEYLQSQVWRNKNISDLYEPGSTFKVLTAAMALEEGETDENRIYSDNPIQVFDKTIKCWTGSGHGEETLDQAFTRSCNPVFVQLAQAVGMDKFYDYVRAFGLRESTGIELPGEAKGLFHENPVPSDLATLSFGEQSTVTPLHQLVAIAACANGGNLVRPHIVDKITDENGNVVQRVDTEIVRRVISEETSARVRNLMHNMVVNSDTRTPVDGYETGGKTSTATNEETNEYTISFVEVAPIDNPQIICMLILQEPQYESDTSANVMRSTVKMTSKILTHLGIKPKYSELDVQKMQHIYSVPELRGMTKVDAMRLTAEQLVSIIDPTGKMKEDDKIGMQIPETDVGIYPGTAIYIYPDKKSATEDKVEVPNFSGMTYAECINFAGESGMLIRCTGELTGKVSAQSVEPLDENGKKVLVQRGTEIYLEFSKD